MQYNLEHIEMTDEEIYQNLKNHRITGLMNAGEWKKLRNIELEKEGKSWSK